MGKNDFRMYSNLLLLSQIGINMLVPIIGGLFVGRWIDSKLGTSPLFLLLCILICTIAAFMNLYKVTMAAAKKTRKK